jgi:hypothetical protein
MLVSSGRTHAASLADRAFQYSLRSGLLLPRVRQTCRLRQKHDDHEDEDSRCRHLAGRGSWGGQTRSSKATVPWPPSAQTLTIARDPTGRDQSSFTV